jgi:hypothetical protein
MGVTVNFWHVADAGKDSVDLLERQRVKHWLKKTYEAFDTLPV